MKDFANVDADSDDDGDDDDNVMMTLMLTVVILMKIVRKGQSCRVFSGFVFTFLTKSPIASNKGEDNSQ